MTNAHHRLMLTQEAFGHAFFTLALPQLPMTLLNSMVAVEALAADLFPGKDCGVQRLGYSITFANFGFCWFGGLPSCHGMCSVLVCGFPQNIRGCVVAAELPA